MKRTILILLMTVTGLNLCSSQNIEAEKVFGGYKFTQNGNKMTMGDLVKTMEPNEQAYDLMKKARSNNIIASVIGFAGGGLIGWPIGAALGGGEPNWALAGIGAGLVVVSIPISSSASKKAKQAVDLYNASLNSTSMNGLRTDFEFIANGNGIGISMTF